MDNNIIETTNTLEQIVPVLSKSQFIDSVKKWVIIDSQLKIVNEKTKKMREMKREITTGICKYMIDNQLSKNKIGISDGELNFYEKKEHSVLTFGYVEKCLGELILDKKQVEYIMQYLKEKREITITQDMRRTYHK